ncbi:MAG: ribosome biogenesis GTP-binding protein YihA/YsxC [bacterium]|nr:YihA family ribosome biogenesis GTP-binding protein [Gammaproteobacteria bacterium]HIL94917.1 YihA family ribosome biogenesis GTP-binding protein [Pseudomonadales bacterium]
MANTRPTLSFEQAAFLKSAAKLSQCPLDVGGEVAFCGRSNAGKSSAINCLTTQRKLARTSKTPGRTQLINFFALTDSTRLVDLPGYGYAKVPEAVKRDWHRNIDDYLQNRHSLKGLILVTDIRHPLKEFDEMMLDWSSRSRVPIHILLTKADKLKRGARQSTFFNVKQKVSDAVTLQVFSSTTGIGKDILVQRLSQWLDE